MPCRSLSKRNLPRNSSNLSVRLYHSYNFMIVSPNDLFDAGDGEDMQKSTIAVAEANKVILAPIIEPAVKKARFSDTKKLYLPHVHPD